VEANHEVVVLSRGNRALPDAQVTHIQADRQNAARLQQVLNGDFDAVIDNVAFRAEETSILMELLKGRIGRYIVTSTAFVYPETELSNAPARLIREDDATFEQPHGSDEHLSPHDRYVFHKRRLEYQVREDSDRWHIPVTVIRPLLQIIGPHTEDGRFAWFWLRVRDGGPIWLPMKMRMHAGPCQLAYAGDVAQALRRAAESRGHEFTGYTVGQPELWSYEEYLSIMAEAADRPLHVCYAPREELANSPFAVEGIYRIPMPYRIAFDVSKVERELGMAWTPMRSWIEQTGAWVEERYADETPSWYQLREEEKRWSTG
jgi:nucleoside-diphosphate-sugar epimerase